MFESTTLYYYSKCGTLNSNLKSCFRSVSNSNHSLVNSFLFWMLLHFTFLCRWNTVRNSRGQCRLKNHDIINRIHITAVWRCRISQHLVLISPVTVTCFWPRQECYIMMLLRLQQLLPLIITISTALWDPQVYSVFAN